MSLLFTKIWLYEGKRCNLRTFTICSQNNITEANYYYLLRRVREVCLEQVPETPAFVEIPMVDHIPAKPLEKLSIMDERPLLRIHNRAGIFIDTFQDMPAEKLQSLVEGKRLIGYKI